MSRIETKDLTIGTGVLEFGNYDANDVFQGYQNVGAIRGTFTLTVTREVQDYATGRPLGVVKTEVIRETIEITFTMSEINVATLKLASGNGVISSSITPGVFLDGTTGAPLGDLSDSVTTVGLADEWKVGGSCNLDKVGLRFTHPKTCGATAKRQIIEVYFAQSQGTLTLPFNQEDWNESEVRFRALLNTSKPAGEQYLRFIDERD